MGLVRLTDPAHKLYTLYRTGDEPCFWPDPLLLRWYIKQNELGTASDIQYCFHDADYYSHFIICLLKERRPDGEGIMSAKRLKAERKINNKSLIKVFCLLFDV